MQDLELPRRHQCLIAISRQVRAAACWTRPRGHRSAQQDIETANAAGDRVSIDAAAVFRGDKLAEHLDSLCRDDEVMVAAAKALATTRDDAEPSPLMTLIRRELIEMDHAIRSAVYGAIDALHGHVVQQHDSRVVAGELILQGQNLPTITQ